MSKYEKAIEILSRTGCPGFSEIICGECPSVNSYSCPNIDWEIGDYGTRLGGDYVEEDLKLTKSCWDLYLEKRSSEDNG